MSAFVLREAILADVPRLAEIYGHAVLNGTATFELVPPDEAEMQARFETLITGHGYPYIVAADRTDRVLGYAYAGAFPHAPGLPLVGRGFGLHRARRPMAAASAARFSTRLLELCEERGFRQMIAVIGGSDHAPSIRLHERAGFRTIGIFHGSGFKFGRWIDTVFMQIPIGDGRMSLPDENSGPGLIKS